MSEEKVLTTEIAEQFLVDEGSVKLEEFTKLEDDAAKILSSSSKDLWLGGLTDLSDTAAHSLSLTKASVSLKGIKALSDLASESFSKHKRSPKKDIGSVSYGNYSKYVPSCNLHFGGLFELSEVLAERLSEEGTSLSFPNIQSISSTTAEHLSYLNGDLDLSGLEKICDDSAESFSWHCGKLDLRGLRSISDKSAENLSKKQVGELLLDKSMKLSETAKSYLLKHIEASPDKIRREEYDWTEIDDSSAEKLSSCDGNLILNRLRNLDISTAKILSAKKGSLQLNGLTELSDDLAKILSAHEHYLELNGISELSKPAALSLSLHKGGLSLNGLCSLSDEAANNFSTNHKHKLDLSGLRQVSEKAVKQLMLCSNIRLSAATKQPLVDKLINGNLNILESLNPQILSLISDAGDRDIRIYLNGLTSITDDEAEILAKHQRGLFLNGLISLSDSSAEYFSNCNDTLSLNGLSELSDTAAKSLAKCECHLYLKGLSKISIKGITVLAKRLKLREYSTHFSPKIEAMAEAYSRLHEMKVADYADLKQASHLHGLGELTPQILSLLEKKLPVESELVLDGITTLAADAAKILSTFESGLSLDGLTTLDKESAKHFECLNPSRQRQYHHSISLNGLIELSKEVAKSLSQSASMLDLNGLKQISDEAAKELAGQDNNLKTLRLNGLEELSEKAAKSLALLECDLYLGGLREISDEAAASLAVHKGKLFLSGLKCMSDGAAKELSNHQGYLELNGLQQISEKAVKYLSEFNPGGYSPALCLKGRLNLSLVSAETLSNCIEEISSFSREANRWVTLCAKNNKKVDWCKKISPKLAEQYVKNFGLYDANSTDGYMRGAGFFKGYRRLEAEAAVVLSKIEETALCLDNLEELDEPTATSLSQYEGYLLRIGLTEINPKSLVHLIASKASNLELRLMEIDQSVAKILCENTGWLHLTNINEISDDIAGILSEKKGGLLFPNLLKISDRAVEHFEKSNLESLQIGELENISTAGAKLLPSFKGTLIFRDLRFTAGKLDIETDGKSWPRTKAKSFPQKLEKYIYKAIADRGGNFSFDKLDLLTDAASEILSNSKLDCIYFDSLTNLSVHAAKCLSKFKGTLYFGEDAWLEEDVAEIFAEMLDEGSLEIENNQELVEHLEYYM